MADKEGKLLDRPKRIKAEIFPYYDPKPGVEKILVELTRKNFLTRYVVNGHRIIKIVNFLEHQSPHHTEKSSNLPDLQEGSDITVKPPLEHGENPPDSLIQDIDSLIPDKVDSVKTSSTKKSKSIELPIPEDFYITPDIKEWANKNGFNHLSDHLEWFKDWAISNNKRKADWKATFRNCIRGNWGKIDLSKPEILKPKIVPRTVGCPKCGRWIEKCVCSQEVKSLDTPRTT